MQTTHQPIDARLEVTPGSGQFEGYASVFHLTDSANDIIAPGAFAATLEKARSEGRLPPLLWQHDMAEPIGALREIFEDSHGLFIRGELFIDDIARAREAYKLIDENVIDGLSIGYRVTESHKNTDGVRVITALELLEISVVTFPANDAARVSRIKSIFAGGEIPTEREFEAFLRDAGLSRKQAKGVIAGGFKSLTTSAPRQSPVNNRTDEDSDMTPAYEWLAQHIRSLI